MMANCMGLRMDSMGLNVNGSFFGSTCTGCTQDCREANIGLAICE